MFVFIVYKLPAIENYVTIVKQLLLINNIFMCILKLITIQDI